MLGHRIHLFVFLVFFLLVFFLVIFGANILRIGLHLLSAAQSAGYSYMESGGRLRLFQLVGQAYILRGAGNLRSSWKFEEELEIWV